MEWAEIDGGTSVIAETISNSVIRCGGTVYVMSGRGMIVNSVIRAGDSILCQRVGNLAGGRSKFSVGYPPHVPESWERVKAEQAEVQSTLEKLWNPMVGLKRKGSRISEGEKSLLEQLVEQRELYFKKQEALIAELKSLNKALDKKSKGRIRCEKLYPFLDVQIGRLSEEITTVEEDCNIHVDYNLAGGLHFNAAVHISPYVKVAGNPERPLELIHIAVNDFLLMNAEAVVLDEIGRAHV